ncbi:MAG: hypothetical protein WBN28_13145 [Lutimonas sp.]
MSAAFTFMGSISFVSAQEIEENSPDHSYGQAHFRFKNIVGQSTELIPVF